MQLDPIFRSPPGEHFFSGYYDKSPFNRGNTKHLALRVNFIDRLPEANDVATVGYFDITGNEFFPLSETRAFNWQQGAQLQWLGPDHASRLIFNDRRHGRFVSVVLNVDGTTEKVLPRAVYTIRRQGDLALTIDYERHYWCRRAYAYPGIEAAEKDRPILAGDSITAMRLDDGHTTCLVALDAVLQIAPEPSMRGATHYLEHMMFSPSGDRFLFYHRWRAADRSIFTHLYVSTVQNPEPRPLLLSGRASHCCWLDEDTILVWGARRSGLGAVRSAPWFTNAVSRWAKPIYKRIVRADPKYGQSALSRLANGDSYLRIDSVTGSARPVCVSSLDRDGHPSGLLLSPGQFVTDTYPDRENKARVLLGNIHDNGAQTIITLNSIPALDNTPYRCDLHPKLSLDERFLSVDTLNEGHRSIYVYELSRDQSSTTANLTHCA